MKAKELRGCMVIIGLGATLILFLLCLIGFPYWTSDTVKITISDKERIVGRNGNYVDSKYLVFTETETFENTDCLARLKFNSSDLQGKLKPGCTYTVLVYGWRIPVISSYRNIVRVISTSAKAEEDKKD